MAEKLTIVIGAKDNFSNAFAKLQSSLPGLKKLAVGTSVAIGGIGAALFAMTKSTAVAYDAVQKFSDQLGLSTDFLSRMGHAAELSGVAQNTLNKSLQIFTVRLGEYGRGIGEGKDALEELGLEYRNLNGTLKTAEQLIPDVAEAFARMTDQTEKAELASKIFGQRGLSMLQMFKDGKDGLAAMTDEAEKFGLVISSKAGVNAAEFNDSLTRLTGSFAGLKNKISEDIMPAFTSLANAMANFVAENRTQIVATLRNFGIETYNMFKRFALGTAGLIDSMKPAIASIGNVLNDIIGTFNNMPKWLQGVGILGALMYGKAGAIAIGVILDGISRIDKAHKAFSQALLERQEDKGFLGFDPDTVNKAKELLDSGQIIIRKKINEINDDMPAIDFGLAGFDDDSLKGQLTGIFAQIDEAVSDVSTSLSVGEGAKGIEPFTPSGMAATKEVMDQTAEAFRNWRQMEDEAWTEFRTKQIIAESDKLLGTQEAESQSQSSRKLSTQTFLNDLGTMGAAAGKKGFRLMQGTSIAEATIKAILAFNTNLSAFPYPVGPILAATALAAGMAQVAAIAATKPPAAHGGLTSVPNEQTYLLNKNERVLSPGQNKDLIEFMDQGGNREAIVVDNLRVNIMAPEPIEGMSDTDWDIMVEENIVPSLRRLSSWGIEP